MKDYKRLTERRNKNVIHKCGNCPKVNEPNFCTCENCEKIVLNRLAELEDKIDSGKLVELPCEIGTSFYKIVPCCIRCEDYNGDHCTCKKWEKRNNKVVECIVTEIAFTKNDIYLRDDINQWRAIVSEKNIKWFLTKEATEAKLAELRGGK